MKIGDQPSGRKSEDRAAREARAIKGTKAGPSPEVPQEEYPTGSLIDLGRLEVMVDIETLSTANDAVILSIGACKFDPMSGYIAERFHVGIDLESSLAFGRKISAGTLMWWLDPARDEARAAWLSLTKLDLATALDGFAMWFGTESKPVWGNGSTFDNVILKDAYAAVGLTAPWHFRHDRDYRTIKALRPQFDIPFHGVKHDALDDAVHQARILSSILQEL